MTSDKLVEEKSPWGQAFVFPVLPVARHTGLSALVTFCTWPIISALLRAWLQITGSRDLLPLGFNILLEQLTKLKETLIYVHKFIKRYNEGHR